MELQEIIKKVTALEEALMAHLKESGEIKTDLKWIKHSLWVFIGAIITMGAAILSKK